MGDRGKRRAGRVGPIACVVATLLTAACGMGDNDPGPGGVTVGEARALDDAAAMLDERSPPAEAQPAATPSEADTGAKREG